MGWFWKGRRAQFQFFLIAYVLEITEQNELKKSWWIWRWHTLYSSLVISFFPCILLKKYDFILSLRPKFMNVFRFKFFSVFFPFRINLPCFSQLKRKTGINRLVSYVFLVCGPWGFRKYLLLNFSFEIHEFDS